MERADRRNGEQVRPLRFHLNAPPDIPLTPPHKERPAPPSKPLPCDPPAQLLGRPAPPNKPLPPDPGTPAQIPLKPLVPVKPRLVAPPPNRHGAAANPAGPKRRSESRLIGALTERRPALNQTLDHLVSVLGLASTVAHELGHNLGMSHDTAERLCSCSNERRLGGCIMEPSTGFLPGQMFSSCSAADLSLSLLSGGGMCLFNVPQHLLGGRSCGNLYVEQGEECDCGLLEECEDPCCNASTCRLVPGAQCSSDGICCQDCKLREAGSRCRDPLGECDLPEFCTGSSPYCPPNVFLQNGQRCEDEASYCYEGVCASMKSQCQLLWGPNATSAPPVCFSSVNKQGNKYGNCGKMKNGSYIPCGDADVQCGRIQCEGGRQRPLLGSNTEILTTTVRFNHSDLVCRGTFFHLGDDVSDPATVSQGTACSQNKACLNQKCQDVSVFGVEECRAKCNGHGVCNSNQNCHCGGGWAPPDCRASGLGGSVDSGPAIPPRSK
ncbi:hypothetical protein JOQ06_025914 [Pogonophryne albipinna]|uniref:Disintegrin and metalloproteinase domain-containing protein 15 n=1 Tax=Pogonophryne albipinna TaxID=1090488 RepID=A0AAD6F4P8_9TELE|nr:hypothetical protein JOQ06_025914 [Pogonophryne albipinna]